MLIEKALAEVADNLLYGIQKQNKPFNTDGVELLDCSNISLSKEKVSFIMENLTLFALPFEHNFIKFIDNEYCEVYSYLYAIEDKKLTYVNILFVHLKAAKKFQPFFIPFQLSKNTIHFDESSMSDYFQGLRDELKIRTGELISKIIIILTSNKKTLYIFNSKNIRIKTSPKKHKRVNKPIYIYCEKEDCKRVEKHFSQAYGNFVRTSSWNVRGHWRRLDNEKKRGKNAQGKYEVEGFTWVKPFIKGNKKTALHKKAYIAIEV